MSIQHECDNCKTPRDPDFCLCEKHMSELIDEERRKAYEDGYTMGYDAGQLTNNEI